MAEATEWEVFPDDTPQREGSPSRIVETTGPWADEPSTCEAFDKAILEDPRFSSVYREAEGIYSTRSPYDHDQAPRIDRLLIPSKRLRDAGWMHGAIGVEIKKPGTKAGRALAQCIDYTGALFKANGFYMPVSLVFLFECPVLGGDLEAITTQHRVGTARMAGNGTLRFFRGASEVISVSEPGRNYVPLRKVGSG